MNYYESRLAQYGLTPEAKILKFKWVNLDLGGAAQTCKYFEEHKEGIEIFTPTTGGDRPTHIIRSKPKFISRIRLENPPLGSGKYKFGQTFKKDHENDIKAGWVFIPPLVYDAVKKEERLQTLWIVEGEFKAFIANMHGMPFIGIPGIHNFRASSKGELNEEIRAIIRKCEVENVVIFYDSDLLELSSKLGKNTKSADARPRSFMRSAENFRRLLLKENVNIFLGNIRPNPSEKLGIDDLFKIDPKESKKDFNSRAGEITADLLETFERAFTSQPAKNAGRFQVMDITQTRGYDSETGSSFLKLRRFFKLEDYRTFFEYHKTRQLKGFESFRFSKILYDVKQGIPVLHDDQTKLYNPIKEHGNAYFIEKTDGMEQISDFRIKLEYILFAGPGDTRRIASFTNTHNETWFTELRIQDFATQAGFLNKIAARPRFTWFGSAKQLLYVKAKTEYDKSVISAKMITRLGWQPEEKVWAFSNGIVADGTFHPCNVDGLVSLEGRGYFLPASSRLDGFSEDFSEDTWFRYLDEYPAGVDKISLLDWVKRMEEVFNTDQDPNGTIGVLYAIFSLFSDIVFEAVRFCPLLYVTGIKGAGKNVFGQAIMALFGRYTPPPNIHNITGTAANRLCAHIFNGIVWFDEYKNDLPKWKQELIKSSHDRTGKTVGTYSNDDRIKRVKYHSPVMVSGQDIPGTGPSDPALANRGILCFLRVTERTEEAKKKRAELLRFEEMGLSHILAELLNYRSDMEVGFSVTYTEVGSLLRRAAENEAPKVSARLIDEFTCLLTPTIALIKKGKINIGKSPEELITLAVEKIIYQDSISEENSEQTQFWSILETLVHTYDERNKENCREGYEYKISGAELILRMSKIYDRYARYARQNNKLVLDLQTLTNYLKNHPAYKGVKRSVYFKDQTTGTGLLFDRNHLPEANNILTKAEAEALAEKYDQVPEIILPPTQTETLYKGEYQVSKAE